MHRHMGVLHICKHGEMQVTDVHAHTLSRVRTYTHVLRVLPKCHLQVLDLHSSSESFPWNPLYLVLAEITGQKKRCREEGGMINKVGESYAKLSQSHLLCSTSTWCNHRNAAGGTSEPDRSFEKLSSLHTEHSFAKCNQLSLFISQWHRKRFLWQVSTYLEPNAIQLSALNIHPSQVRSFKCWINL